MFRFTRSERAHRRATEAVRRLPYWDSARGPMPDGTLRQAAGARLIAAPNQQVLIPVALRYGRADPLAVHIDFPSLVSPDGKDMTWSFARELLAQGLYKPAGIGDVYIWPCGPAYTIMEFRGNEGRAVAKFDTPVLRRFLLRSYALVERGGEEVQPALVERLAALLGEA
ncbi:SsgA family sporulation/cell division regulator [Streptomyces shenzhenensis]